ncbi:MAG: hypothetical protein LBL45_11515 [Treponema sp.]|nr:hypothetical protein [Treponema sp.]
MAHDDPPLSSAGIRSLQTEEPYIRHGGQDKTLKPAGGIADGIVGGCAEVQNSSPPDYRGINCA